MQYMLHMFPIKRTRSLLIQHIDGTPGTKIIKKYISSFFLRFPSRMGRFLARRSMLPHNTALVVSPERYAVYLSVHYRRRWTCDCPGIETGLTEAHNDRGTQISFCHRKMKSERKERLRTMLIQRLSPWTSSTTVGVAAGFDILRTSTKMTKHGILRIKRFSK